MMRNDPTDSILNDISENNQSYVQLSYFSKKSFLNAYDPICRIENCFVCKLSIMTYFTIYLTKNIIFIKLRNIFICIQYYYFHVHN